MPVIINLDFSHVISSLPLTEINTHGLDNTYDLVIRLRSLKKEKRR